MTDVFDPARHRLGTFALIDRVIHEASYAPGRDVVLLTSWRLDNPDPDLYLWDEQRSQWRAEVPVDRCERVYSVHVYAKYRGRRVRVEKVNETASAVVMYAEWDGLWATENGFLSRNGYEYYKTVPLTKLEAIHEKHDDLLFNHWRAEVFPRDGEISVVAKQGLRPRSGLLATYRGREYPVLSRALGERLMLGSKETENPDPELFAWHPQRGLWTAVIPSGECDRVVEVTTRAEYVGYPCEVVSIEPDGAVELYYLGDDRERAVAAGFTETGNGNWINTVDIFDLARYHELHREISLGSAPPADS